MGVDMRLFIPRHISPIELREACAYMLNIEVDDDADRYPNSLIRHRQSEPRKSADKWNKSKVSLSMYDFIHSSIGFNIMFSNSSYQDGKARKEGGTRSEAVNFSEFSPSGYIFFQPDPNKGMYAPYTYISSRRFELRYALYLRLAMWYGGRLDINDCANDSWIDIPRYGPDGTDFDWDNRPKLADAYITAFRKYFSRPFTSAELAASLSVGDDIDGNFESRKKSSESWHKSDECDPTWFPSIPADELPKSMIDKCIAYHKATGNYKTGDQYDEVFEKVANHPHLFKETDVSRPYLELAGSESHRFPWFAWEDA